MHAHDPVAAPITRYEQSHERSHKQIAVAALLLGAAAMIFSLAVLLYVFWLLLAPLTATPFDADGVRCYHRAVQVACLKTANP